MGHNRGMMHVEKQSKASEEHIDRAYEDEGDADQIISRKIFGRSPLTLC